MSLSMIALVGGVIAIPAAFAMLLRTRGGARRSGSVVASGPANMPEARKKPQPASIARASGKNVHAVSIRAGLLPCGAVRQLGDQRFLSDEAPTLPLSDCDSERCECRYRHHADRRQNEDRRLPFQTTSQVMTAQLRDERRRARDRRGDS